MTHFLIVCALLLLLFVEPPSRWWVATEELSGDRRVVALSVGLLALLVLMSLVSLPGIGNLGAAFDLQWLTLTGWMIVALVALLWTLVLRAVWRSGAVARMLGLEE